VLLADFSLFSYILMVSSLLQLIVKQLSPGNRYCFVFYRRPLPQTNCLIPNGMSLLDPAFYYFSNNLNNITRGSRRWIDLGFTSIQPSEIVKPWLMLFLANTQYPLLQLIPVGIIMLQPDLGSAISTLFLLIPIILYDKKLFKISLILFLVLAISSPLIYKFILHDYQRQRIIILLTHHLTHSTKVTMLSNQKLHWLWRFGVKVTKRDSRSIIFFYPKNTPSLVCYHHRRTCVLE
jgi:hypothetical protein